MISTFVDSSVTDDSHPVDIKSSSNDVKPFVKDTGPALEVTDEQECVLWHNLTTHKEQNHVPCALLKKYADSVRQTVPTNIWMPTLLGTIIAIYVCCACCWKKKEKETVKEEAPLNELRVPGYCSNY